MDNVVDLPVVTKLDIPPDKVLAKLMGKLADVVVVGWDKEGHFRCACSMADGPNALWLLEMAKTGLLEAGEEQ